MRTRRSSRHFRQAYAPLKRDIAPIVNINSY